MSSIMVAIDSSNLVLTFDSVLDFYIFLNENFVQKKKCQNSKVLHLTLSTTFASYSRSMSRKMLKW